MRLLLVSIGLVLSAAAPARAVGPEIPEPEVSILPGGATADGRYLAGLRIGLPEGWKTYWRQPGDSGIPPSFDWSGSRNLDGVEVVWPAPSLFDDEYGWVIGYKDELVLPLLVEPAGDGGDVALSLDLSYAVCKEICVPAEARLSATLPGGGEGLETIEAAVAAAPQPVEEGAEYGVVDAELVPGRSGDALRVSVRFPEGAGDGELLIEGPADWYLPVPERVEETAGGVTVFEADLPSDADAGGVAFTATGLLPGFSFEQRFRLD